VSSGVSGGTNPEASGLVRPAPWVVSLAPGTARPALGSDYFLRPGYAVFPSGLAGRVTEVAAQLDGSTRLKVAATDLSETLAATQISYADGPPPAARSSYETSSGSELSFPSLGPNVFRCQDRDDAQVSFEGQVGLRIENLNKVFDFRAGRSPYVNAYITGRMVSFGKVTAEVAMTCDLRPAWQNANRKIIPLGSSGATFSFGPTAQIKISASGTVSFEQATRFNYGYQRSSGGERFTSVADQGAMESQASGSLAVEVSAGISVQAGILDRVGVELKGQVYVEGSALFKAGPPPAVCLELEVGLKASVGAFLDLWIVRWEATAWSAGSPSRRSTAAGSRQRPTSR